ncbi:MAG: terminase small subunit [Bacteroidales bacterium]|nr:terminase small subunit [Bacteroidales bacterium]
MSKKVNATKLTEKQKKFVDEYLVDFNATRSYRAAYPSCKKDTIAGVEGHKLLKNPKIVAHLQKRIDARQKRTEITQDRVLREYARLGFFDPRQLFKADGSPRDITELDDDTAAAIAGLEVIDMWEGKGEDRKFVGYLKKYKLANKIGALDSLGKHLGMFVDRQEVTGPDGGAISVSVSRVVAMTPEERREALEELRKMDTDADKDT